MAISYAKQTWDHGEVITATKLNNIENGIAALVGNINATETRVLTKELDVASSWSETGNITDNNARIIHADTNKVSIYKGTDITGTTTIKGDFEVKSGNNTLIKASTTGNTTTTAIHGNAAIDTLQAGTLAITGAATLNALQVGSSETSSSAIIYGTLETTGKATLRNELAVTNKATIGGTLEVTGATTLSNNLSVTGNSTIGGTLAVANNTTIGTASQNRTTTVYGNLLLKDGNDTILEGKKDNNTLKVNINGTTTTNDLVVNNKITSLVIGTTTTDTLTVNNKITSLTIGTTATDTLTVNNKMTNLNIGTATIDSLTIGTPKTIGNNNETIAATGTTTLYGTTTIDSLTVGAIKENENTGLTEVSGETTLHGITKIDNLIIGQYPNIPQNHEFIEIVGYGADDNNTNNIRTLDIYGNQQIAGTYYGNNIVTNKFNGIDIPALPIVEDSLEDPKPYKDGEYTLKLTITDGQPSYSWVAIGGAEP